MSPELFYWERFGFKDGRQTERSDCYALGMVVYEVLSGQVPFSRHHNYTAVAKVLKGERPARPRGTGGWFMDDIWSMLERCWRPSPGDRPIIGDVFRRLEKASRSWTPLLLERQLAHRQRIYSYGVSNQVPKKTRTRVKHLLHPKQSRLSHPRNSC